MLNIPFQGFDRCEVSSPLALCIASHILYYLVTEEF